LGWLRQSEVSSIRAGTPCATGLPNLHYLNDPVTFFRQTKPPFEDKI